MKVEVVCERCGVAFTPKRPHARFCSDECRWQGWRAKRERNRSQRVEEARSGIRGGSLPPLSLVDVQTLFESWRSREYGWVRAHILLHAAEAGEWHSDHAAEWELAQPNLIGAAVNALAKAQLLEKKNRHGGVEHRRGSSSASHGRASYVWRATERGKQVARHLYMQRQAHIGFFKSVGVGAGKGVAGCAPTSVDPDPQPTLFEAV